MSLIFCDSFDYYTALATKWNAGVPGGAIDLSGALSRTGPGCCVLGGAFGPIYAFTPLDNLIVGTAFYPNQVGITGSSATSILTLTDAAGQSGGQWDLVLGWNADMSIWAYQSAGYQSSYGVSAPNVLQQAGYNYVEAQLIVGAGSAGRVVVRVNGAVVITFAGGTIWAPTGSATAGVLQLRGAALGGSRHDDVYLLNAAAVPNDTFLGAVRIFAGMPDADSAPLQWTPSVAGTHFPLVDSVPPDLTKYVESNTPGQIDQYLHSTAAVPSASLVLAVQHSLLGYLDAAGSHLLASCVAGAVGPSSALTVTPNEIVTPYDVDPATGAAWVLSDIPNRHIGPDLTA